MLSIKFYFLNRQDAKKRKYLSHTVGQAFNFLQNNQVDKASMMYEEGILAFNSLSEKGQLKEQNRLVGLCQEIDAVYLNNLLTAGFKDLDMGNYEDAYLKYKQVQSVYKRVSDKHKGIIFERCNELFTALDKIKKYRG